MREKNSIVSRCRLLLYGISVNPSSSHLDPSTMAAIAKGWLADHVPDSVGAGLEEMVEEWRERGNLPLGAVWLRIVDRLRQCGCFDSEVEACRMVLSLQPNQSLFQLRLAEALRRVGEDEEAEQILASAQGPEASLDAQYETLLAEGDWGTRHRLFINHLVEAGAVKRADTFFRAWMTAWGVAPACMFDLGVVAMMLGDPGLARRLFTPFWVGFSQDPDPLLGRFEGVIPPYDEAVEAALVKRIEAAFALDEADLPVMALSPAPSTSSPIRVLMVTFNHGALTNDLAEHFSISAAQAGLEFHLHLDSALVQPDLFQGSDTEVERRIAAFTQILDRLKPDVVMVDCLPPLILRGLNPGLMVDMKETFGFRLVCIIRDAHCDAMPLLDAWLPACDSMVVFEPLSPVLGPDRAPENHKVVVVPVPALHGHFLQRSDRDLGLTFAGSVNWQSRYMLLAILMTEDIAFTALFGTARARETPDAASYARFLGRSRAVLNVSRHTREHHLVTGRVWEAIAAGSLLVEQNNSSTPQFFTPYRHYLPWTDPADIVHIAHFIQHRPDLAEQVAAEGHRWALRHYGVERLWSTVLDCAFRPASPQQRENDRRAAHDWIEIALLKRGKRG